MNKSISFKKTGLAVAFFALSAAAHAQVDSLQNVVREALEYNPEVQAKFNEFEATTHDRREAFGGYLPSLDIEGSLGTAERQYDDGRGAFTRNYAEARLTQMLFDGFQVKNRVKRAEHASRQRYYDLIDEAETKAMEVVNAYIDVERYREMVRLAQVNLDNHKRVQKQIAERADRGVSNQADLTQINGRVSLAESNLLTEVANLQSVSARFQRLVGRLPAEQAEKVAQGMFVAPTDIQDVLTTAYASNAGLLATFENIEQAHASLGEAKSGRYPKFDFIARHGTYRNNNSFDNRDKRYNYGQESIVEIRGRMNLYRGGSDMAAERAARSRINQAEDLRDKACVDIRQTASIAHSDIGNLQIKLDALQKHRDGSRQVVTAYREQFDIGRRSLLDVLDSENEAFQAERAYVHGQHDLILANVRTLHSMGQLLGALGARDLDLLDGEKSVYGTYSSNYCSTLDTAVMDVRQYLQGGATAEVLDLNSDTLFDVGSSAIKPAAMASLKRFISVLQSKEGNIRLVNIVGHTDNTGSLAINRKLSLDRATAVRDALLAEGLDVNVLKVSGMADSQPVASNNTAAGRAENRRVTLTVVRD